MSNPDIKAILDAVAKASSKVMEKADEITPTCENCGHPIPQDTKPDDTHEDKDSE